MRQTAARQQCEFEEGRRLILSLSIQVAHARAQALVQTQDQEKTYEQKRALVAQEIEEDMQEDWMDAEDLEEQGGKEQNNQQQQQQQQAVGEIFLEANNNNNYNAPILERVLFKASSSPPQEEHLHSFYSPFKLFFLAFITISVLVSITLLFVTGHQHHRLYQSFIDLPNAISLSKDSEQWMREMVPDSVVREARVLVGDLMFLARVVGGSFERGSNGDQQQGLRLIRTWS